MTVWIIIPHVLLLKLMRFWSDRVWCVLCGYGPVIFTVIWVINSRAGWVKIWQYRAYMSSHYRWNISTRVLTCRTCLRCRNPIVCVLVLLLSDYQLCFDSTQSLSPTETYQIKGLYLICNSAWYWIWFINRCVSYAMLCPSSDSPTLNLSCTKST